MLVRDAYVKNVTNISNLSSTHFVSDIDVAANLIWSMKLLKYLTGLSSLCIPGLGRKSVQEVKLK